MTAAWARHGDLAAVSPAEARRIAEEVRAPWTRGGPRMERIAERRIRSSSGAVRVRIYDPRPDETKPVLIYLHGGGWTLFSLDTHDRVMREYAGRAGNVVIGVDYALSPEAKYPVALEQVVTVVKSFAEEGSTLAIGGDSAGANLTIAACLRLRDEGNARLVRAMLINYGVFARHSSEDARRRLGGAGNMLTSEEMERYWHNYLRDEGDAEDPLVSPLRSNLHGLPSAFLVVPELDLLGEQSIQLADRLKTAGVPVQLNIYRGAVHSFLEAVSISSLADRAFNDSAHWLRASLDRA